MVRIEGCPDFIFFFGIVTPDRAENGVIGYQCVGAFFGADQLDVVLPFLQCIIIFHGCHAQAFHLGYIPEFIRANPVRGVVFLQYRRSMVVGYLIDILAVVRSLVDGL
jgi:hypothetical protein